MPEQPKPPIDHAVEDKIDDKIEAAKIIPTIDPNANVSPTTTKEQDLQSAVQRTESGLKASGERAEATLEKEADRQRRIVRSGRQAKINFIWEFTQSYVAVMVVTATALGVFIGRILQNNPTPYPSEWWTIVGLVIGFYFGRTNHARMGDEPRRQSSSGNLDDR